MLKLIKYEIRRNLTTLTILFAAILCLEAYALISMYNKDEANTAISFSLLMFGGFAGIILVFAMAVKSYSKELGSKYSCMTFMTPTTTYGIIGSKLLVTGIVALITTVIAILLIILDYNIFINQFSAVREVKEMLEETVGSMGYLVDNLLVLILVNFIVIWLTIFTWICLAYLAITLSATAFSNKKYRGVITVVLFVVIVYSLNKITSYLPNADIGSGITHDLLVPLYSYLVKIITIIGAFLGSALLLDKKVSL